jgi:hypothetical protein
MTGFETKFFCNSNIAHFRFNFVANLVKINRFVSLAEA